MFNQKIIIARSVCLLAAFALLASGCSVSFKNNNSNAATDGGFWVSLDKGASWRQVSAIPTVTGAPGSIAPLDASCLTLDPGDVNAIYFGSTAKGLLYTYNIGGGWNQAASLNEAKINSIAVSPDNKCQIYAAAGNKVYRSNDCSRSWAQVYFDNDVRTQIGALAVDQYDSNKVFFGNSRGEIIRSLDRGDHWMTVLRSGSNVNEIIISPHDSRKIFVTTVNDGIFRTADSGDNWLPLKDKMAEFKNSFNIVGLIASPSSDGLLFAATAYGLLKSDNNGDTWSKIQLVTPEKEASINSLAVNPKNPQEIYYVTKTTFYSSADGGVSWRAKKLPTTRAGWKLLIKPDEVNVIFMGVRKLNNNGGSGSFGL
jgi:photosystem II stability/assembly factor-like uncharacterized protein